MDRGEDGAADIEVMEQYVDRFWTLYTPHAIRAIMYLEEQK